MDWEPPQNPGRFTAAPAAPVRSSKNAATARSSTGTSTTARPGQDPNWLVITTRPRPPAAPARHRRRIRHVIQDQQPVIPAGQHRMHPPHRIPAPRPQMGGQLGEPRRQPCPILGRQLPHHRAAARLPVGVLHCHAGLTRTPQPAQHHHPRTRAPPGRQPGIQPGQQLLPARQEHRPRRQPHRHPRTTHPPAPALRRPQLRHRLEQAHLQLRGRTHELHRDPRVLHPLPEPPLPLPEHRIRQKHPRQRQDRVLIQHEHQPRQTPLPGRGELQLRIRTTRLIPHRRPVRNPIIPAYTSARPTCSRQYPAGLSSRAVKYAMSTTTPLARDTACSAAATNDRPAGLEASSDV